MTKSRNVFSQKFRENVPCTQNEQNPFSLLLLCWGFQNEENHAFLPEFSLNLSGAERTPSRHPVSDFHDTSESQGSSNNSGGGGAGNLSSVAAAMMARAVHKTDPDAANFARG